MGHDEKKSLKPNKQKNRPKNISSAKSGLMNTPVSGTECPKQEKNCFECTVLDCPEEDA